MSQTALERSLVLVHYRLSLMLALALLLKPSVRAGFVTAPAVPACSVPEQGCHVRTSRSRLVASPYQRAAHRPVVRPPSVLVVGLAQVAAWLPSALAMVLALRRIQSP